MAQQQHRILLLGSGMVVQPVVDYLLKDGPSSRFHLTIVSLFLHEAVNAAKGHDPAHVETLQLDVGKQAAELDALVAKVDIVISLVPAPMHPLVAQACLKNKKHLLTASYISPAMKELDSAAKEAGVIFLNELGLDPGIDHMSAMAIIDEAKHKGGKIRSFVSWCGALPAPDCMNNPLGYKFSWSPRGVLSSAGLPSSFLWENKSTELSPESKWQLLLPVPVSESDKVDHMFDGVGNRDSVSYIDVYGLNRNDLQTMFRGTLRWPGFGTMVRAFMALGLFSSERSASFDPASSEAVKWREVLGGGDDVEASVGAKLKAAFEKMGSEAQDKLVGVKTVPRDVSQDVSAALAGLKWLGITADEVVDKKGTPIDSLCALLEKRLSYGPGERDIVVMQHEFIVEYPSHSEKVYSTLVVYGDNKESKEPAAYGMLNKSTATAKTVGLPVAMAAELILQGSVPQRGVIAPIYKEIYTPMLNMLRAQGIDMKERAEKL